MSTNLEWDNQESLRLLDLYERHSVLWNPRHTYYYNKAKKTMAWDAVARACGVPTCEVKRKMESLLSSFRRERCKSKRRQAAAAAAGGNGTPAYNSRWFAYKKMSFLLDKDDTHGFLDYDDNDPEQIMGDTVPCAEDSNPLFAVEAVYDPEPTAATEHFEESSGTSNQQTNNKSTDRSILPKSTTSQKILRGIKRPASDSEENSTLDFSEALGILKSATANLRGSRSDDCSTYGEHVANKLREYNKRTKAIVQHHINNILFQADMGEFENTTKLSTSSTYQSNATHTSVDSSSGLSTIG